MSFDVGADAYGRFMGRYAEPLAHEYVARVGPRPGHRAVDVGCGPGAMSAALADVIGTDAIQAVDPSARFVAAARDRLSDVEIQQASAEHLPFAEDTFDLAVAQLVVNFMTDPVAGLAEMARVTKPGGVVTACVWDHAGGRGPLSPFWTAVHDVDPAAHDESGLAGAREGHLAELFDQAGLRGIEQDTLTVVVRFDDFETWWEPFTLGVGPAGDHVAHLTQQGRDQLRDRCRQQFPESPFDITAIAWLALGHAA